MATEIELLNAVADQPYEAREAEWKELLRSLRLGLSYVPAIQAVVQQGRWKIQPNPMAYIRNGAVRCAVRMGIVDIRPNQHREILASDLHYSDPEGEPLEHDEKLGLALHQYEETHGADADGNLYSLEDEVPDALMDESLDVDWDRVANLAEMDAGERMVLDLRLIGFGREGALAACSTDDERKWLQAAWKRFDRHKDALKAVLQSGESHPTRRVKGEIQPQIELIFLETPDGGLKISFRKVVPEK
ncbi:MAG: hypothetical protein LAO78_23130 [Acidobacteriia bacterium]|nr:hypothetical protein [Terriglobia bacterium]